MYRDTYSSIGCSEPSPVRPWMSLGIGLPPPLGSLWQLLLLSQKSFFLISDLNLPCFRLKKFPLVLSQQVHQVSLEPPPTQAEQRQFSLTVLIRELFKLLNNFCRPFLDVLQQVHIKEMGPGSFQRCPAAEQGAVNGKWNTESSIQTWEKDCPERLWSLLLWTLSRLNYSSEPALAWGAVSISRGPFQPLWLWD